MATRQMQEYTDTVLEDFEPPSKKPCFKNPTANKEIEQIAKGFVHLNTQKNTAWAEMPTSDHAYE